MRSDSQATRSIMINMKFPSFPNPVREGSALPIKSPKQKEPLGLP